MGTCYSSKSKSASQPYSSAPMSASSSQDSALRLPRATPYTRGTVAPADTSEVNFRRCIPPPTKYRANNLQSGNLQGKANATVTTDFAEKSRRAVTDNADVNNPSFNNNFEDGTSSQDFTNLKKDVIDSGTHNVTDSCSLQLRTEGAKASSESSERIQYGGTKIPTKITAHLSGLPKPQVAVVTTRVPPVPQRATSEKLHAATRISNQPVGEAVEKRAGCQHRVSPDKESISDRSHSGDSGSTDYDSGLGHSLSDPPAGSESGGKAQSSSTTLQVESSPVLKEAVGVGNELDSAVLPTTLPVGAQLATVDGTASKMGVYDQPDSYAAYRGILSYRRITPLKKYSEAPQWKRTVEPKTTKGFSSPTRAVIAKGILTKGAKAAHAAKDCSPERKREGVAKGPPLPSAPLSPSKEEKSAGFLSPTSDGFLIDDDISDQPGLIALERSRGRGAPSVKKSIFELHALQSFSGRQTKVDRTLDDLHPLCSDAGSSCSSLGSDDLMLDFETSTCKDSTEVASSPVKYAGAQLRRVARPSLASQAEKRNSWDSNHSDEGAALRRASDSLSSRWPLKTPSSAATAGEARPRTVSLPLRPPRQVVMQECDDGSVKLDSSSYRSVCQDLNGLKTMLLKLRRILQDAETLNPFELSTKNYFYHALASTDLPHGFTHTPTGDTPDFNPIDPSDVMQENMDLKRQLILMQQQLEDKDRTIHLLQQQMTKYMDITNVEKDPVKVNAAVQTERPKFLQSTSSSEEGSSQGRLVSSDIKNALEDHFKSSSICHAAFRDKIEDVSKSLSNITQALRLHSSKPDLPCRSQSSWELLSQANK
uniref:Uncharacterized protein n=1 Tax=Rhipicephalus zambeziensis TaxID=60191 RepID=A0A224YDQ6_9ACAR